MFFSALFYRVSEQKASKCDSNHDNFFFSLVVPVSLQLCIQNVMKSISSKNFSMIHLIYYVYNIPKYMVCVCEYIILLQKHTVCSCKLCVICHLLLSGRKKNTPNENSNRILLHCSLFHQNCYYCSCCCIFMPFSMVFLVVVLHSSSFNDFFPVSFASRQSIENSFIVSIPSAMHLVGGDCELQLCQRQHDTQAVVFSREDKRGYTVRQRRTREGTKKENESKQFMK